MKKIGEGWQYTVYDIGHGRVYKRYNSWQRSLWIILKDCFPHRRDVLLHLPSIIKNLKKKAQTSLRSIKNSHIESGLLGNPTFKDGLDYEQDLIVPFHVLFEQSSESVSKKYIDAFIELNKKLVTIGMIDKFFNISRNFGINKTGDVIIADLGELITDKEKIKELQKQRVWAVNYKSRSIENEGLRTYFIEQMDQHLKNV